MLPGDMTEEFFAERLRLYEEASVALVEGRFSDAASRLWNLWIEWEDDPRLTSVRHSFLQSKLAELCAIDPRSRSTISESLKARLLASMYSSDQAYDADRELLESVENLSGSNE